MKCLCEKAFANWTDQNCMGICKTARNEPGPVASSKAYTNVNGLPLYSNKSSRPDDDDEEISSHSTTPSGTRQHKPMLCLR